MGDISHNKKDKWIGGKYIDLWSLVHFLAGTLWGFFPSLFGLSVILVFPALLAVAVSWEFFELHHGITEKKSNSLSDITVSIVGFVLVYVGILFTGIEGTVIVFLVNINLLSGVFLSILGWSAYRKRDNKRGFITKRGEEA